MAFDVVIELARRFEGEVEIVKKSPSRIYADMPDKAAAISAVKFLFVEKKLRFSIATAVDMREGIEILYHMAEDASARRITVRTLAKKPDPEIASCMPFMPAAEWIEREIHEMFGVNFAGHPDLRRLLLPDDWPEGMYPLRKGN